MNRINPQLLALCVRFDWKCQYCGIVTDRNGHLQERPTKDHMVPRSRNGRDLTLACGGCNTAKADSPAEEFAAAPFWKWDRSRRKSVVKQGRVERVEKEIYVEQLWECLPRGTVVLVDDS